MDELLKMMQDGDASIRVRGIHRLADEYFGRCVVVPGPLEDALIDAVGSDPSAEVRLSALRRISSDFEWWGDSPVGAVNLDLLARILSVLPSSLGTNPRDDIVLAVAEIIGRLGSVRDLSNVPESVRERHDFKGALLDGLARRDLYSESESLLRIIAQDPDAGLRRIAEELLDDT